MTLIKRHTTSIKPQERMQGNQTLVKSGGEGKSKKHLPSPPVNGFEMWGDNGHHRCATIDQIGVKCDHKIQGGSRQSQEQPSTK
jgi:hypothetical protein